MEETTVNAGAEYNLHNIIEQEIEQYDSFEDYMNDWYTKRRFGIQNMEELTERQAYLQARQRQDKLDVLANDTGTQQEMLTALKAYEAALKKLSEADVKTLSTLMPDVDVWCPISIRHALEKLLQEEEQ